MLAATLLLALAVSAASSPSAQPVRYGFYRAMDAGRRHLGLGSRRVFGGHRAEQSAWGAACVLLDRYWATRCSASVLTPRWVLTAAHCVSPDVAYVKYNSRLPAAPDGNVQPVHYLYRHPGYKVVHEDVGYGMDVTLLHHDVGLVRTRHDMHLEHSPSTLNALTLYYTMDMRNQEVEVLGFGRTERSTLGEELFSARLWSVACDRGTWFHCTCGVASGKDKAGVCVGDSGGPVLYRGTQVGVTSMGPVECAADGDTAATAQGTSVFTMLAPYAALINATMNSADAAVMRMERMSPTNPMSRAAPAAPALALLLVGMLLLLVR